MGRRLILDTNILIAYERGTIDRSALDDDELAIASVSVAEYRAGIELARRERPDLILMDLSLPVVDGWEATRRLKADAATRAIPVIALTAHAMRGDEERARACGCDDYLTKPIDEDRLFEALARHLAGAGPGAVAAR